MTQPFVGEIQMFGFSYAPKGWAFCAGQSIAISQNTALFSLIGTTFGGNGQTTFMLPNLAARQVAGIGQGPTTSNRFLGETFGSSAVTLTSAEMPAHNHNLVDLIPADPSTNVTAPTVNSGYGYSVTASVFGTGPTVPMSPSVVMPAGGNAPHPNQQPYLGLNHCIALYGNYPSFP